MPTLNASLLTAPGVYVQETQAGLIPAGLASYNRIYMLGTGTQGPFNTPTQVISTDDYENQFGTTPSVDALRVIFANYRNAVVFFSRVGAPGVVEFAIGTPATGAYTIGIDGTTVTFTATSGQTATDIAAGLASAINLNSTLSATLKATAGTAKVVVESLAINATFAVTAATAPAGSTNVESYWQYNLTAATPTAGVWSATINGTTVSYTAPASPTLASIVQGLSAAIAASAPLAAVVDVDDVTATGFTLAARSADTLLRVTTTAPGSGTLTATPTTQRPVFGQYLESIEKSFDPDIHAQGILIAPDAFENLLDQYERVAVGAAMEALCSAEGFAWNCFVDCGPPSAIVNVAQADAESALYTSAQGHLAFYSNYMVDLEGRLVPPSAAVAGIYLARASAEGFQQPAAGGKYPIKGISGLQWQLTKAQQAVSNPMGNNLLRYLPNQGNLVYGSRTRSNSPFYRFVNTRIILNVLIGTLRGAFDELVFSAVDGRGVLFSRIRETAEAICYRLYQGGALFGATPDEAFFCQCNDQNNPDLDLEDGVVRLDCYVAPVPTMERLLINVVRTAIGQVQIVAQQVNQ
jgi:hypothetical protein